MELRSSKDSDANDRPVLAKSNGHDILNELGKRCENRMYGRRLGARVRSFKGESPTRISSCRSAKITISSNQFLCLQPTISPSRSTLSALQRNFKARAGPQTLMQAFGSNVYRGPREVGGSAIGLRSGHTALLDE